MSILNIRTFANLNYGLTETHEGADGKEFMLSFFVTNLKENFNRP